MSSQSSQNRVQWVYSSKDNQQLAERYDEWSKDYEKDLADDFVYLAPLKTSEVFAKYVPKGRPHPGRGRGHGAGGRCSG